MARRSKRSEAAALLGLLRWATVSEAERREHQRAAAKSYWSRLTPEQRAEEMRRRRRLGLAQSKIRAADEPAQKK